MRSEWKGLSDVAGLLDSARWLNQVYDAIDVFAGKAVLSSVLRSAGYATATLDVLHWSAHLERRMSMGKPVTCKQNPLDLRTAPGFARLGRSLRELSPPVCTVSFKLIYRVAEVAPVNDYEGQPINDGRLVWFGLQQLCISQSRQHRPFFLATSW